MPAVQSVGDATPTAACASVSSWRRDPPFYFLNSLAGEASLFVTSAESLFEQIAVVRHEIQTALRLSKIDETLAEKSERRREEPMAFG